MFLVVGQSPAKGKEKDRAILNGCKTGEVWRRWCIDLRIDPEDGTYCNVLTSEQAIDRSAFRLIEECIYKNTPIFVLGEIAKRKIRKVLPHSSSGRFIFLPHPSGLNRKLNDKKWVEEMLCCAREKYETFNDSGRSLSASTKTRSVEIQIS